MNERREPMAGTVEMPGDDQFSPQSTTDTPNPRSAGGSSTADLAAAMDRRAPAGTSPSSDGGNGTATTPARMQSSATENGVEPLFESGESEGFRSHWSEIQTGFVDEPRRAVEQADSLVAEVIQRLAQIFADERTSLEQQWDRGDDISTEDLRQALRRYRSFFERLLAA